MPFGTAISAPPAPPTPTPIPAAETGRILVIGPHAYGLAFLDSTGAMVSADGHQVRPERTINAAQALGSEHSFDAHFTCYGIANPDLVPSIGPGPAGVASIPLAALSTDLPRITKGALSLFEHGDFPAAVQESAFSRITPRHVVGTAIAIDVDNPAHTKWTDRSLAEHIPFFAEASTHSPLLARPTCWYTTSGGCRYVWLLAHPIPVEGVGGLEDLMRGMVASACIAGMPADYACKDWTRVFRLPRVRRADKAPSEARTQEQHYLRMSWGSVDPTARNREAPEQVLVYPASAFRCLSQMAVAEFQHTDMARACAEHFRTRIGVPPTDTHHGLANIRLGEMPNQVQGDGELFQVDPLGNATTKPTAKSLRARRIIETLANPKAKDRKPVRAAQNAVEKLYEGRLVFTNEAALEGLHEGMVALTADVCYCLRDELGEHSAGMTPQFVQSLVMIPAMAANNKRITAGRSDARSDSQLRDEVWRIVSFSYRRYRFQRDVEQEEREEAELAKVASADAAKVEQSAAEEMIKAQLREWAMDSIPGERERQQTKAPGSTSWVEEWVSSKWRQLLILECNTFGRSVLSILPSGQVVYSPPLTSDGGLYMGIRDSSHDLIQDSVPQNDPLDPVKLVPVPQLMRSFGTVADFSLSRIIKAPLLRISRCEVGQPNLTLIGRAQGIRTDVEPVYDGLVEEWLITMAGESSEKLMDWLACFPRITHPIAGLYLQGSPGIGKGMLGVALSRLTESGVSAPFSQVIDQFQDTMLKTPLVWADEEAGSAQGSKKSIMNMYKKLVTGEFNNLNPKGKGMAPMEGHWRVLLTANSDKLLDWNEDVNEADMGALTQRVLHVNCDSTATAAFLSRVGGRTGTEGWPEKQIPQHIMWLAKNRKVTPGSRLLVEGVRTAYHDSLAINTGGTDLVVRALGIMLATGHNRYDEVVSVAKTRATGEWHAYVNLAKLQAVLVSLFKDDRNVKIPQQRRLKESVRSLSTKSEPVPTHHSVGGKRAFLRLWDLDVPKLLRSLRSMAYNFDLRAGFDPEAWLCLAPADIREEVEGPAPAFAPSPAAAAPIRFPSSNSQPPGTPPRFGLNHPPVRTES